jgi:hypothetical protein
MVDENKKRKSLPERLMHAWEPLKSSFSVVTFGIVGVAELLGWLLDLHEKFHKWGVWPHWAPAANVIFVCIVFAFFLRAVFLLAEENGELTESLLTLRQRCDATTEKVTATAVQYCDAVGAIRDLIHDTRESMLRGDAFLRLLSLDDKEAIDHLYSIVERQIARIQHGMRSLTNSHCNVCLKVVKLGALGERDGLVTVCYGPAVPLDRRAKSLVLPTNQGIAAEALITKDIAFSNNILTDDRFWPRDRRQDFAGVYQTAVSSPVIVNDLVRGVLCFDWAEANMYDSIKHRSAVAAFTDVVGTAFYITFQASELGTKGKNTTKL